MEYGSTALTTCEPSPLPSPYRAPPAGPEYWVLPRPYCSAPELSRKAPKLSAALVSLATLRLKHPLPGIPAVADPSDLGLPNTSVSCGPEASVFSGFGSITIKGRARKFQGRIIDHSMDRVRAVIEARDHARKEIESGFDAITLWVDASLPNAHVNPNKPGVGVVGGLAVVYAREELNKPRNWEAFSRQVPVMQGNHNGELEAIAVGLEIAAQCLVPASVAKRPGGLPGNFTVIIFSDSRTALHRVRTGSDINWKKLPEAIGKPMVDFIITQSYQLASMGCSVELRFIPGHKHQIPPHVMADKLAGEAAKRNVCKSGLRVRVRNDSGSMEPGPRYQGNCAELKQQAIQIARTWAASQPLRNTRDG